MRITEIVVGVLGATPKTLRIVPRPAGLTIVPISAELGGPDGLARAVRETLASPDRSAATAEVPFVRVIAELGDLELTVADDATGSGRMLTETHETGVPLIMETNTRAKDEGDRDARLEALLARVCLAAGVDEADTLLAALAHDAEPAAVGDAEAHAYAEAHHRASTLAREVRAIDDRMTASVVPDWLWIATGLGGIAVLMTVVALLYPELRIYVVPAMIAASVLGFGAYGYRAWRELQTRGGLMIERKELRARREAARAEARTLRAALVARGVDADGALLALAGTTRLERLPAVLGPTDVAAPPSGAPREATAIQSPRQRILFTRDDAALPDDDTVVRPSPLTP
jgi:hypothetical protein